MGIQESTFVAGALAFGLLAACDKEAPPPEPPATAVEGDAPVDVTAKEDVSWWETETACPEGTTLKGTPPPDGTEVYCARDDETKHGRSTKWDDTGTIVEEGEYAEGAQEGLWHFTTLGGPITAQYEAGKVATVDFEPVTIGVPQCDDYISQYVVCVKEHVPPEAKLQILSAIATSIAAWKEAAAESGEKLAGTCEAALETARKATADMGCTWE